MSTADPDSEVCGQCGQQIPPWAPAGNCPSCLLGSGKKERQVEKDESSARERIGEWELGERIGEGAFGVVYAAAQARPVRRSAAIKILRPGMSSKEVLARFEAESQALALMNHPDIVTIYDADTTDDGRPYLVMELVPGVPATEYAAGLPISQRLILFDRICAVVEHAHRHGIIHRDLKPGNILVYDNEEGGKPSLKLLDFGLAKATEQVLTEATILTSKDHFLGTPEYMSPEQAGGGDIDTRSDVYSLGVILFELLVGHPPFVLRSRAIDDVFDFLSRVREETPPRASEQAKEEFQADLDWIVGKAIEKNPERRYRSVSALREDLQRFENDEPIEARPPDTLYLARKFMRRHWKVTSVAAAIALTVSAAAVISSIMAVKARRASQETRRAYSQSDLQSAVNALDERDLSRSIAYQVRSLRTDPGNADANRLLRSTLTQFPIAKQERQLPVSNENLRQAFFVGQEGNAVTVSQYGKVRLIGPDGKLIAPVIDIGDTNQYAQVNPGETLLAVTTVQGAVYLIDLIRFEIVFEDKVESRAPQHYAAIEFSKNGKYLCLLSSDRSVRLRDGNTGKLLWRKDLEDVPVSMVYSDVGERVVVALLRGGRIDFSSRTGELLTDVPQQPERVNNLVSEGSGYRYYTVSTTGIISACDNGRPPRTFTEEQIDVPMVLSAYDPKRRLTAYFSKNEVSVWTVLGITIIRRLNLPDPPAAVELHPDRDWMFIGTEESGILLWDFENRELFGANLSRAKNASALRIYPDESILRCITVDGFLQEYRLHEPEPLPQNSQKLPDVWANVPLFRRNPEFVRSADLNLENLQSFPKSKLWVAAANSNGDLVFGLFREGQICIWEKSSGLLVETVQAESASVRTLDVSADGKILAFRDRFGNVAIFDRDSGEKRVFAPGHGKDFSSVALSPDGTAIATASDDGSVLISSVETFEPNTKVMEHDVRGKIAEHFCQFSSDGETLVTWGEPDRSFRLWDAATGEPVGVPIRAEGTPRYAQFEQDDRFLVTVFDRDKETMFVRIWSLDSFLPVTPERTIKENRFDFSNVTIPESAPFAPGELDKIEYANGVRFGENGMVQVPLSSSVGNLPDRVRIP